MIATDGDGRFEIAAPHEFVYRFAHLRAFAVTQPADARRQSLKLNTVARETKPAIQSPIVGAKFKGEIVSLVNIRRVTRQRDPTKRTFAFAKKRPDILGYE